jgi:hypothetical protein
MTFKVIKEQWTPDGMDCEHPLCERLHKPFHKRDGQSWYCAKPSGVRTEWQIVDDETGERLETDSGYYCWDLKRDAVQVLRRHQSQEVNQ